MNRYKNRHRVWIKIIATIVVCLFFVNTISWAITDEHINTKGTNLQVQTAITTEDGFIMVILQYFSKSLRAIENDIDNQNVHAIRERIELMIKELRKLDDVPETYKEHMPTLGGSSEKGDVIIDFGAYAIRYYNPAVSDVDPGVSYRIIQDEKRGRYMSRQILEQGTFTEDSVGKAGEPEQEIIASDEPADAPTTPLFEDEPEEILQPTKYQKLLKALPIILILALGFALRAWNLDYNVLWMDEGSYINAGLIGEFPTWVSGLLYLPVVGTFVKLGMHLGFDIAVSARFLNVIFGTAIIAITYKLAGMFKDKLTKNKTVANLIPIFTALIVTLSPGPWFISRYATYDAMAYMLFGLGLLSFFKGLDKKKTSYLWVASGLFVVAFATKYVVLIYYPILTLYAVFSLYDKMVDKSKIVGIKIKIRTFFSAVWSSIPKFILPLVGMTALVVGLFSKNVKDGITATPGQWFPASTLEVLSMSGQMLVPAIVIAALIGLFISKDKRTGIWLAIFSSIPVMFHIYSQHSLSMHKLVSLSSITGLAVLAAIPLAIVASKVKTVRTLKMKALFALIPIVFMYFVMSFSYSRITNNYQDWRNTEAAQTYIEEVIQKDSKILSFELNWTLRARFHGMILDGNVDEQWSKGWEDKVKNGDYDIIFLNGKNRIKHLKALELALLTGKFRIAYIEVPTRETNDELYYDAGNRRIVSPEEMEIVKRLDEYYPSDDENTVEERTYATYVLAKVEIEELVEEEEKGLLEDPEQVFESESESDLPAEIEEPQPDVAMTEETDILGKLAVVVPGLIHGLIAAALRQEKVVLALDQDIGEGEVNKLIRDLSRMLATLDDNNEELKRFLKNIVVYKANGRNLALKIDNITSREKGSVKPENIIVITKGSNMGLYKKVEGKATIAGIDDKTKNAYIPLIAVLALAVSKHLGWKTTSFKEQYDLIHNAVKWDDLDELDRQALLDDDKKTFVIRLIPNAEAVDTTHLLTKIRGILTQA